jgi:hypothetical protein
MTTRRIGMQCSGCGLIFTGEGAFNKHRGGSYGKCVTASNGVTRYKHERRCLSEDEMKGKGLSFNDKGLWTTFVSGEEMPEEKEEVEV